MTCTQQEAIKGRLNHENYQQNQRLTWAEFFQEKLEEGAALWDIPFDLDEYEEDNDTEEMSSDDEVLETIDEVVLTPERPIKFYMKQEKKSLPSSSARQLS